MFCLNSERYLRLLLIAFYSCWLLLVVVLMCPGSSYLWQVHVFHARLAGIRVRTYVCYVRTFGILVFPTVLLQLAHVYNVYILYVVDVLNFYTFIFWKLSCDNFVRRKVSYIQYICTVHWHWTYCMLLAITGTCTILLLPWKLCITTCLQSV